MGSCLTSRPPLGNGKDTNGRGNGEASSTTDRPEGSWGVSRVVLQTPYRETSQQKVRNSVLSGPPVLVRAPEVEDSDARTEELTVDAGIQTLSGLFGTPISYRIPVFQRPYAWTKEKQWQPLWSDAQRIAEKLLVAKCEENTPPHFMGAIVLQLQSAKSGHVVKRIVVDGQQRLTTLQLLIRAAQEAFQNLDDTQRANRMSELTLNDQEEQGEDIDSDTKVRQSNVNDLQSFQDVIRGLRGCLKSGGAC